MTQEKQHDIALMRYSVISPIINGLSEEYSSLDAFYRDAAKKGAVAPDGTVKHFSAATIERWYRSYKNGGFDALIPQGRVDEGKLLDSILKGVATAQSPQIKISI